MAKFFKFKREIGYPEIISIVAILLSAFAIWKSHQNDEGFIVQGSSTVTTTNLIGDCLYVVTYPIQFHNSGKKAVSLERFIPAGIKPIMFSSGGEILKEEEIKSNLYLHRNYNNFNINEIHKTIQSNNKLSLSDYKFMRKLILPGDTFNAAFVITIDKKQQLPKLPNHIFVAINTEFSNNQELEYTAGISLTPEELENCN